ARGAIAAAARRFDFSDTARLDAELLMAEALDIDRDKLLLSPPSRTVPKRFWTMVERRSGGEPIAYITGARAFWTIDLAVGPGVLIPRADSETLLESSLEQFRDSPPRRILDLGTGPGTLLLAALDQWPDATGIGVDSSPAALAMARANAARLGMADRAVFRDGDWGAGLAGRFDLILANPPYIGTGEMLPVEVVDYEPADALFAGEDGLDAYRRIAPQLSALLAPGGAAVLEIGATQADAVSALLVAEGFDVMMVRDLAGHARALIAT
ncbi:MAG: peptide chain release factor N(5)-glutamine methyltransferase, partial [Sphingomonas sp.]